jgi:hypothetical protein
MKKILGAAIGNCVHVWGLYNFLKIAESEGFAAESLGPAVKLERLTYEIVDKKPNIVALSYRLTDESAKELFGELKKIIKEKNLANVKFIFGGTPPNVKAAKESGIFDKVFEGTESIQGIKNYLKGGKDVLVNAIHSDNLTERISSRYPYPIIRHHFGRPTVQETIEGAKKIAESELMDVISLGIDQNAQEHFFHPERMEHQLDGAGGVPVRSPDDMRAIYEATRCGNFPLLRCYSGTNDLIKWAEMSLETIKNAWAAIPLCWYSVIDGRSKRTLKEAISENQKVMKWYADKEIPVEVNESHQWSLREAHDSLAVTMFFLAAYNAKRMGAKNYVAQFMFNTPPGTWMSMDIAKMSAKLEMIEKLSDDNFNFFIEARPGIAHFSPDPFVAKGQLGASIITCLSIKPHILHVVGFSEGDHAIYPEELIESCQIAHGVLRNCLYGAPDYLSDSKINSRKNELIEESLELLESLKEFGIDRSDDAWSDPVILSEAIKVGILDAPHFRGNEHLCGKILTRVIDGAYYAVDESTGEIIREKDRLKKIIR